MSTEADPAGGHIRVEVAYATPGKQCIIELEVPAGCTVGEAIGRSGIDAVFPGLRVDPKAVGIFSRKVNMDQVLRDGDRVEIYRPLIADPKEVRRQRAKNH
jgi:putative ubiquitin-RnfH superfamily antitoxin RatB of RatAB toxin-antitoxin module